MYGFHFYTGFLHAFVLHVSSNRSCNVCVTEWLCMFVSTFTSGILYAITEHVPRMFVTQNTLLAQNLLFCID